MRARRIATIALGVIAAALLLPSIRGVFHPPRVGTRPAPVILDASAVTDTSSDLVRPSDTEPGELGSAAAETPLAVSQPVDTSDVWGRSFDECVAKRRLAIFVCKQRFEPRDPNWAPEAEQRIRDFVADTPLLQLPAGDNSFYHLECRATFCQVHLKVDRAGLTDHLRSLGRYDERRAREHEFPYLTLSLTPSPDGRRNSRWAEDRAEELRLALVLRGLLGADSTVAVHAVEPAYREQDSFLWFELSRCPSLNDLCAAQ
jgi:hypothetical protein